MVRSVDDGHLVGARPGLPEKKLAIHPRPLSVDNPFIFPAPSFKTQGYELKLIGYVRIDGDQGIIGWIGDECPAITSFLTNRGHRLRSRHEEFLPSLTCRSFIKGHRGDRNTLRLLGWAGGRLSVEVIHNLRPDGGSAANPTHVMHRFTREVSDPYPHCIPVRNIPHTNCRACPCWFRS